MKVIDPKLIGLGIGVFGATFLSAQIVDALDDQPGTVGEYAREIAGAALTVGGSFLMGARDKNLKTAGLAMGATGVSTLASGIVRRVTKGNGKPASTPPTGAAGSSSNILIPIGGSSPIGGVGGGQYAFSLV